MIFILTAMPFEAEFFKKHYNLQYIKNNQLKLYGNDDIILCITGIGKLNAASSASLLFSYYSASKSDFIINYGICGANHDSYKKGNVYLINRIYDNSSSKEYIPDIIYKHGFDESSLITIDSPFKYNNDDNNLSLKVSGINPEMTTNTHTLFDMEASGIYVAGSKFITKNKLIFLKTVSDFGDIDNLNKDSIIEICNHKKYEVIKFIDTLSQINIELSILNHKEINYLERITESFSLTENMKRLLYDTSRYIKLKENSLIVLETITHSIKNNSNNKKEFINELRKIFK